MRSKVQKISPARAAEMLEANTSNRPLSRSTVRSFAEAKRRGEWLVTHQGIAFDISRVLVDGQHRLAAVIEAELPVEMTVFTDVEPGTLDVLDTGKKRNTADVLAIEGKKSTTLLAAMVRAVWQYQNRPDQSWSGGAAGVTNHQIVQTLEANPGLRDYVAVGDRIAAETGMIKSAAGAAAYLVDQANPRKKTRMTDWHDGIAEGAGLDKSDPRLIFRKAMFAMARKQAGVVQRHRDNREHVVLYLKAFNAWAAAVPLGQLRYTLREPAPAIMKVIGPHARLRAVLPQSVLGRAGLPNRYGPSAAAHGLLAVDMRTARSASGPPRPSHSERRLCVRCYRRPRRNRVDVRPAGATREVRRSP